MTLNDIVEQLKIELASSIDRSGIMYRLFGRAKTLASIEHKLGMKGDDYKSGKGLIRDIIGLRIVVYFPDDVDVMAMFFDDKTVVKRHIDTPDIDTFRPQCLNITKPLPGRLVDDFRACLPTDVAKYIDNTYEIQIRTVFSEGWHEVEHDLRYKCKEDWVEYEQYGRTLNGILATLETSEWALRSLFQQMATANMMQGDFRAMLRNKMRIRLKSTDFSPAVTDYLRNNPDTVKAFLQSDRLVLLFSLMMHKETLPLTYDNILFLINRIDIDDKGLAALETPDVTTAMVRFLES
ncbi:MAG: GTP pyrophosphokinase [Prevotella sp.]